MMQDSETPADKKLQHLVPMGLHLVATPIGRARDITLHALDVLRQADVLVAEDTRVLRKLLTLHGIAVGDRTLIAHHDHSKQRGFSTIEAALLNGKIVAYASDAGTPMVSDPGLRLVTLAHELGAAVHAAPGPSSILTALVLSGLPTDRFFFGGFLPVKAAARQKRLEEVSTIEATVVLFDTPKRFLSGLNAMADLLGSERDIAICRELTKRHEQVVRGQMGDVLDHLVRDPDYVPEKGELVIVIGPPKLRALSDADIEEMLTEVLEVHGVNGAAAHVAGALGVKKSRVYSLALKMKRRSDM
ncbi:MAG: 16S rRNA (cytidine(1402)-2'-O)-methyltransferase [Pseudomonadota bacterium]